jgi:glycosyltransferase involved in cell wall biosynthesis
VFSYFPVLGPPSVVGVHDVTASEYPRLVLPGRMSRTMWRAKEWWAVRRAAQLFTVSHSAQAQIVARLGVPVDRVPVVGEAPAPVFFPRPADQVGGELAALGLSSQKPFLLCAGGINPHKNVDTLLHAYAALRHERPATPPLVIVGALEGSYVSAATQVRALIGDLGLVGQVRLPGFVPDEALACLYSAAAGVVIPSLAEGFGLPAVEAAACGAAVVASDIPAHRETLRDGGLFFEPRDRGALVAVLEQLLDDQGLSAALGQRGREAVARFSWTETARRLREVIGRAAGRRLD